MKVRKIIALLLSVIIVFSLCSTALTANIAEDNQSDALTPEQYELVYDEANYEDEFVPGEVIVGFKSDVTESNIANLFPELDIIEIEDIGNKTFVLTLREETRQSVIDAINILKDDSNVYAAEPNYYISAIEPDIETVVYENAIESLAAAPLNNDDDNDDCIIPNDRSKDDLWNLDYIDAFQAWAKTTGSSSISIGVLDTGITPIADLAANVDMESGVNCIDPNSLPLDDHGHGTQVASIIGAVGNNGTGIAGVCWNVNLIPFKVLDSNKSGDVDDAIEAVNIAAEMGIPILNMSFETNESSSLLEMAIKNYDGLVVAAAGNNGRNIDIAPIYPACYAATCRNVIVVGASARRDDREFAFAVSNYGRNSVHIFAPGAEIFSVSPTTVEWTYGSSIAAPHVAGAAALILSLHPEYTTEQVMEALIFSVDPVEELDGYCMTGGRLNINSALEYIPHLIGDINNDGRITTVDVTILAKYLEGLIDLTQIQWLCADFNRDGYVNETDLDALVSFVVNGA